MAVHHHTSRTERLLVAAAFITALGNNVQLIAGALIVVRADRTMMAVGWLFIAVAAPQALLSPVFGRLVDRFDRRTLWFGSDITSAVTALALPLWLAGGGAPGPGIYAANFALAVVSALFFPASAALIKERVRPERLRAFNAHYETATQAGMLLSATAGGLAVQAFGVIPLLLVNVGTFAVSAICVIGVGRRPTPMITSIAAADPGRVLPIPAVRTAGLSMSGIILLFAQGSVVVTVFNALLPVLVLGELHRGAGTFGAIDALGGLGFLFAASAYRILGRRFRDLGIAVVAFLGCDVLFVFQPHFGVAGLAVLVPVAAFIFGQARIASRNLLMASVDANQAGRAFGVANGSGLAATIMAMLIVATITDQSDTRYGFAATAALSATATLTAGIRLLRPKRVPAAAVAYEPAVR
ncbi:MFS transporter [Streptomyces sp. AK04-3B]|uniref:MFS transporter n=1 Tax=Streptomyces sp. AK04-3B TaxID=3028650 RepID=UPI0029B2762E|nr:MFS transporter [Streptomyces sp. AK04-3B]MDX3801997.1 MFS transporter [Streptomyces sp. AK04-3B]